MIKKVWLPQLLAGCMLTLANPVNAQEPEQAPIPEEAIVVIDDFVVEKQAVNKTVKKQFVESVAKKRRSVMLLNAQLQIDELQRTCQLDTKQVKRLQVAAKGASNKIVESWAKNGNGGGQFAKLRANNVVMLIDGKQPVWRLHHAAPSPAAITDHPLWKKAVKSTLTVTQRKAYQQLEADRMQKRLQVQIEHTVLGLDESLRLSNEQQDQLRKALQAKHLTQSKLGKFANGHVSIASLSLAPAKMKNILSDNQFEVWNRDFHAHANHGDDHDHDHEDFNDRLQADFVDIQAVEDVVEDDVLVELFEVEEEAPADAPQDR